MTQLRVAVFSLIFLASMACCSEGVDDIVKMQGAGVEDAVLQAFVDDSPVAYNLNADDIQRLEDAKVPATVIVAMLDHGKKLRNEPVSTAAADNSQPAQAAAPVADNTEPVQPVVDNADNQAPAEAAAEVVAPPEGQANISLFYEAMAPYGTWSQDESNGWVWQPNEVGVDPNWRPYANNGHWTWTDHGWYFESASPYGWAAFHYGRWGYNHEHRWCWAPDNVWGPAWVDWRESNDHIGWAPLPFGSRFEAGIGFSFQGRNVGFDFHEGLEERDYAFVQSDRFLDVNLGLALVPEQNRHAVYNQTKIINNTYVYNNNRVVNKGVSTALVERATKRQLEAVKVVDANIAPGQPIKGERRNDNTISVYRPKVANAAPILPPAIIAREKSEAARAHGTAVNSARRPAARAVETKANQSKEQDARRRLAQEKATLRANAPRTPVATPVQPNSARETVNNAAEAEAKRKLNEVKAEEKVRAKATNEAAAERKVEAAKEAKQAVREERQPAKPEVQRPEPQNKVIEERKAANEAAAERKVEAAKEAKQAVREERQSAKPEVQRAAPEEHRAAPIAPAPAVERRPSTAAAAKEEREESKSEKAREAK